MFDLDWVVFEPVSTSEHPFILEINNRKLLFFGIGGGR